MKWQIQYETERAHVRVAGFIVTSEAECREYFARRVAARLAENDNTEALREHLVELDATGFSLGALADQIANPPAARDWEIGEALAEVALRDGHEAMFPWPTGSDKRTPKASLPGPDLVGLQRHDAPRFVFGQVKSTSEQRVPPQVVCSTDDCLRNQMRRLLYQPANREQLIGWLLVRMRDTAWEAAFNEALQRYADGDLWLVGVLVSGNRPPAAADLVNICEGIGCQMATPDVQLLGFYLPFHKDDWAGLVAAGREASP
jgi:hypothetical protein